MSKTRLPKEQDFENTEPQDDSLIGREGIDKSQLDPNVALLGFTLRDLASTFDGLIDTPSSKTGFGGYLVRVNAGETDLEYVAGVATDEFVKVDAAAVAGYIGATASSGVVRTAAPLTKTDNGDYVTIGIQASAFDKAHADLTDMPSGSNDDHDDRYLNLSGDFGEQDKIQFATGITPTSEPEGLVWWNDIDHTLNISTGTGTVLQTGQEFLVRVYNNTGDILLDGKVVTPTGGITNGILHVDYAKADVFTTCGAIVVLTQDIADGTDGFATIRGKVRGLDTSGLSLGTVWLSPTAEGEVTNTKPEFPNYVIRVGDVTVVDAADGEILVSKEGEPVDTTVNFWNGCFREKINFTVTSNGTVITGNLEPSNGYEDMTMLFSDGFSLLDTSPPATVTLTAGADDNPQTNYVYIPKSTKVLTASTSDWPIDEHIKVATVVLQSASATQIDGALRNQNWNDEIQDSDAQGHLAHITERIRQEQAKWESGTEGSVVIDSTPTPDDVYVKVTGGVVYQLHRQDFPAQDMTQYAIDAVSQGSKTFTISDDGDLSSIFPDGRTIKVNGSTGNDGLYVVDSTVYSAPDFIITVEEAIPSAVADGTIGDDIHVVNNSVSEYKTTTNLNTETLDATGSSLTNKSFSFVVWGVMNRSGEVSHIMLNLPTGSYLRSQPDDAVNDADNYAVYDIPKKFQGVGFLVARFTFTLDAAGNVWTLYSTEDLRGKVPNISAGAGGGGGGVNSFLGLTDTQSDYTGFAEYLQRVNAAETALEPTLEYITTVPALSTRNVIQPTADVVPFIVQAYSGGQTENLGEWRGASPHVLAIDNEGHLGVGTDSPAGQAQFTNPVAGGASSVYIGKTSLSGETNQSSFWLYSERFGVLQTARFSHSGSSLQVVSSVNNQWIVPAGNFIDFRDDARIMMLRNGRVGIGATTSSPDSMLEILSDFPTLPVQRLREAVSQSANAFELRDSNDNDLIVYEVGGGAVFNEYGNAVDFRVEGDTDENLLFVDGSADTVQVGAATASDSAKFYVDGKISTSGEMEINGDLNHDGSNVGFFGVSPTSQQTGYTTFANLSTARTLDADSTTLDEVADVLGTLIEDIKAKGLISA